MSESEMPQKPSVLLGEILRFVEGSSGLQSNVSESGKVAIHQSIDGKIFHFEMNALSEVLQRFDNDGKAFIQINFLNGFKVLFTDTLVGFKPLDTFGLDMTKIPKVVTTPDLLSVFTAIEDGLASESINEFEIDVLKRVYSAIIQGGEASGFDLQFEKKWLSRLLASKHKASA